MMARGLISTIAPHDLDKINTYSLPEKDNILQFDEYLRALSLVTGKAGAEAKLKCKCVH